MIDHVRGLPAVQHYTKYVIEAHCYALQCRQINCEQNQLTTDCRTFWPLRPLSAAYKTLAICCSLVQDGHIDLTTNVYKTDEETCFLADKDSCVQNVLPSTPSSSTATRTAHFQTRMYCTAVQDPKSACKVDITLKIEE